MSEQYKVHVHGIDLSVNMVLLALERAANSSSSSGGHRSSSSVSDHAAAAANGSSDAANGSAGHANGVANGATAGICVVSQRYDVTFEVADVMTRDFPAESFDAVHSRDSLLHLHDKQRLFSRWVGW
jgi:hypothetical protein